MTHDILDFDQEAEFIHRLASSILGQEDFGKWQSIFVMNPTQRWTSESYRGEADRSRLRSSACDLRPGAKNTVNVLSTSTR